MLNFKLPPLNIPKLKPPKFLFLQNKIFAIIGLILISSFFGFLAGTVSVGLFYSEIQDITQKLNINLPPTQIPEEDSKTSTPYSSETIRERAVISVVKTVSPAVVSIIVTKDLPIIEEFFISPFEELPFEFQIPQYRQKGTQKQEIGGGTGFIVSKDGLVLTNRHVVSIEDADYTVLTNDGRKFPATVLAIDPGQDLAIIKIESKENFPIVSLGNSDNLEIGQTVIAIGNSLGEFRNTVSVGVISGLGRTVTASGGGIVETLTDIIQTDAAINKGNSGGPLLNLKGEVIGVNTAMALGAENIGFAIPINKAKKDIEQVKTLGKIVYPFLGVRYVLITDEIQRENNLPTNYGAWIIRGSGPGQTAIFPGSAAEKVGLKEEDIILEFNEEKITTDNTLAKIIMKYNPGDTVVLKILRNNKEKIITVTLGEKTS